MIHNRNGDNMANIVARLAEKIDGEMVDEYGGVHRPTPHPFILGLAITLRAMDFAKRKHFSTSILLVVAHRYNRHIMTNWEHTTVCHSEPEKSLLLFNKLHVFWIMESAHVISRRMIGATYLNKQHTNKLERR